MHAVTLTAAASPALRARLRPLTGADEAAVDPGQPEAATSLLRRLVVGGNGWLDASGVDHLTLADHDRLLAAVFDALYGDQVEARTICAACGERLEITLSLTAFAAALPDVTADIAGPHADGTFTLPDGRRIRPPSVADLANAARGGGAASLRAACVIAGDPEADPEALDAALEAAAPALARDVSATCPHCATTQPVRFDLAAFLVAALARERPFLLRETHLLARAYGWSHAEILALSRDDRRALARLCEAERAASRRAA
ncbi:hypothetical protein [Limobrevibacterium gyesilva]|uniref:Phage baseplate protein n=1 Tax=Limobrevibacterium gyesilva TaxID=2991712 RepID=A0AA42CIL9_9PROT|nr:hypothetical protein [Limobrevibacterium gyesilva]MCW3476057.1 hypothetical protein [Limobrevibacterium gyesilva]